MMFTSIYRIKFNTHAKVSFRKPRNFSWNKMSDARKIT